MKFRRTFAAITAAAMAVSSLAVVASAEEATVRTDEEYFELIKTVASVSAKLTVNELAPETAGGFAAFYMQNQGGDWAWFAGTDDEATADVNEDPTVKLTGAGEYEVKWDNVQSVITKTAGTVSITKLKAPAEEWESYPAFGIQVGSDGITEAGATGKVDAKVTGVVITFTDGSTMELPEFAVAGDLLGKEESWGLSGNNVMFNMVDLIKAATIVEAPADDDEGDDTLGDSETVGESEEAPEKEPAAPAELELANGGKTVIDAGLVRTNIINAWAQDPDCVIVEKEAFAGANLVSVKFTVTGVTEAFDAWLSFADSSWACQFWGEGNEANVGGSSTIVKIEKDGTYVITATLDQVIDAMEFIAVCTNLKAAEGDAIPTITIDEIMINEVIEEEEEPAPGESSGEPTNPDTGVVLVVVPAALAAAALATSGIVLKKRSK